MLQPHPQNRFNSTLVRLKGGDNLADIGSRDSFNSTLVRLKGGWLPRRISAAVIYGFNSTLVRLKAYSPLCVNAFVWSCFNSTLVRLKAFVTRPFTSPIFSFNSTLVRLKVTNFTIEPTTPTEFQFHTGSIKSPSCSHWKTSSIVSIPHWFD